MAERKTGASRRTTPKGGRVTPPKGAPGQTVGRPTSATDSGRYTPPIPREQKVSPMWVPILMFALLGLGVLTIVLNYVNLLPGDASNGYLLLGLGFITAGFITATNYH
jgi:hypothetical protein